MGASRGIPVSLAFVSSPASWLVALSPAPV
jgi:hypothetical protein